MYSGSVVLCFFFQAEDGIRDAQESRGLGDVYKRQVGRQTPVQGVEDDGVGHDLDARAVHRRHRIVGELSLIHI